MTGGNPGGSFLTNWYLRMVTKAPKCDMMNAKSAALSADASKEVRDKYQKRTVGRVTFRRILVYTEPGLSETGKSHGFRLSKSMNGGCP